jgi:alkylhydroperoxidase/carboxymuconolactone decarboxylase family protein YurZ
MTPRPPKTYSQFVERFPELGQAWELLHQGARTAGPLAERDLALVKLGIAIAARSEGAVHSAVRKARAQGIAREAIEQVVALAASTIGLPQAVAAWTWVNDELGGRPRTRRASGPRVR